jgi:hypothetical protein
MSFENRLSEFKFNWETLQLLQEDESNQKLILSTMNQLNFNDELTNFLLENSNSYVNSVLVRLKLYHTLNKSFSDVQESLKKYPDLVHLTQHLFNEDKLNLSNVEKEQKTEVKQEVKQEVQEDEDKKEVKNVQSNLEEEDDDDHFSKFFKNFIKQTKKKSDSLKSAEAYSAFTEWYVNDYGEDVPSKKELKNFLNDKLGKSKKSSWYGVTLNA